MPGQICMSLLYKRTQQRGRKAAFTNNNLTIEYEDWKALESIMGRNAREIILSDGSKFEAGNAKFKWMMLPYSRLVVSLSSLNCFLVEVLLLIWILRRQGCGSSTASFLIRNTAKFVIADHSNANVLLALPEVFLLDRRPSQLPFASTTLPSPPPPPQLERTSKSTF
jgi:hypothetical protein